VPTQPTKLQGKKRKYIAPSTYASKVQKSRRLKPLSKLPAERTYEENKTISEAETKAFFAAIKDRHKPQPKEKIPVSVSNHFLKMYDQPSGHVVDRPSDYDRCIIKTFSSAKKSGKTIDQLGKQGKKAISPLKVLDTPPDYEVIARCLGMSVEALLNENACPKAEVAWKYVVGEALVRPERIPHLPTQLRNLHDWYMRVAKEGRRMLLLKYSKEHYFREGELIIEFDELFQLFNQDALDKTIVSSYCL
jgi:hypothetical protein